MLLEFLKVADIDIFAFLVLSIILFSSHRRTESHFFGYRLFMSMVIVVMVQLSLEALVWTIDGISGDFFSYLNLLTNSVYFVLNPLSPMLWVVYTHYQLNDDKIRAQKALKYLSLPFFINILFVIVNLVFPIMIYIDDNGRYKYEWGIIVTAGICFLYIAIAMIFIVAKYKKVNNRKFFALLLFSIPPVIGGVVDMFFVELSTLWPSIVISLLFVYINLQHQRANTDSLTGLYNRRYLDEYLDKKVNEAKFGKPFALILIDIDGFKAINDTYGHVQGDLSLEDSANIIHKSLRIEDFIARYAGDEFVAIVNSRDYEHLITMVSRIKANLKLYNSNAKVKIGFSIGYDIYEPGSGMKPGDFIKSVDLLMYKHKRSKK